MSDSKKKNDSDEMKIATLTRKVHELMEKNQSLLEMKKLEQQIEDTAD